MFTSFSAATHDESQTGCDGVRVNEITSYCCSRPTPRHQIPPESERDHSRSLRSRTYILMRQIARASPAASSLPSTKYRNLRRTGLWSGGEHHIHTGHPYLTPSARNATIWNNGGGTPQALVNLSLCATFCMTEPPRQLILPKHLVTPLWQLRSPG